jgi:alpha-L-fucosidase 2
VRQADSLVLLVNVSTDYRLHYPDYKGRDPAATADSVIETAANLGYEALKEAHIADYTALYSRVKLELDDDPALNALPTDERWQRLRQGKSDLGLKELVFNLGRYLIISSSRPGTLPANLQGKWNTFYRSPWAGNYQSNINIQEIYWSCGPTNLRECGEPYVDWIKDLAIPGHEIAERVYGTAGWVSHTTGNIYGHAAPTGALSYGVYPVATVWHCRHLWDQYSFSMDTVYLAQTAYPLIKEAVRFWLLNLVPFKGYLIVAPSVSAEHGAFLSATPRVNMTHRVDMTPGAHMTPGADMPPTAHMPPAAGNEPFSPDSYGAVRYTIPGAYQDAEMLRDLFSICIAAAEQLHTDAAFCDSVREERDKLLPFRIGRYGQLQEWWEDLDAPSDHHRHIAHLYAVAPGNQISPFTTPRLAAAAKVSLDMRGEKRYPDDEAAGGNWSRAWRIWCWARLLDGNRADKIFTELLTEEGFENLLTFQHATYHWNRKDLFTQGDSLYLHFQLDASATTPGFMAELLLQSQLGELDLLPALPDAWKNGRITGLRARGGYTVDLSWKDGRLVKAVIRSRFSQAPKIRIGADYVDPATDSRVELHLDEH